VAATLAEVLQRFGPAYLRTHWLKPEAARAWRAIVACRTRALGGQRLRCEGCGTEQWRWHSCRNRHCPRCQTRQRDAWRAARLAELLDVPYAHLVFTLPHELNALAAQHPRWVYDTLMRCVAGTLTDFAADPKWLGGVGSFTLVLHTWTQDLRLHPHVHALMACGALSPDGKRWLTPTRGERFLFPVHALSKVFKGRFIEALTQAGQAGELERDPAATALQRAQRLRLLRRHDWVVYAKTALAGPGAVLDYLSRYTHRTAIGHERLVDMDDRAVRIRVRADADGLGHKRSIEIDGEDFIGRLMQHVLPSGFKRIRHFGLLAPAAKARRLATARQLLGLPQANPVAREQAQAFMQRVAAIDIDACPHCKAGKLRLVEQTRADRWALAELMPRGCRGPP